MIDIIYRNDEVCAPTRVDFFNIVMSTLEIDGDNHRRIEVTTIDPDIVAWFRDEMRHSHRYDVDIQHFIPTWVNTPRTTFLTIARKQSDNN